MVRHHAGPIIVEPSPLELDARKWERAEKFIKSELKRYGTICDWGGMPLYKYDRIDPGNLLRDVLAAANNESEAE